MNNKSVLMHKKQPQNKSFDKYGVVHGKNRDFYCKICAKLWIINLMGELGVDERQAGV
jgi:hypothetical protein